VYVLSDRGRLVFKADVGVRCGVGLQVEGVYVVPERRGERIASRCMSQLSTLLLQVAPRLTLHVHAANRPAVAAYEQAGYQMARLYRLILVD
jgi:predicted GNAT family acetyltransferase